MLLGCFDCAFDDGLMIRKRFRCLGNNFHRHRRPLFLRQFFLLSFPLFLGLFLFPFFCLQVLGALLRLSPTAQMPVVLFPFCFRQTLFQILAYALSWRNAQLPIMNCQSLLKIVKLPVASLSLQPNFVGGISTRLLSPSTGPLPSRS